MVDLHVNQNFIEKVHGLLIFLKIKGIVSLSNAWNTLAYQEQKKLNTGNTRLVCERLKYKQLRRVKNWKHVEGSIKNWIQKKHSISESPS